MCSRFPIFRLWRGALLERTEDLQLVTSVSQGRKSRVAMHFSGQRECLRLSELPAADALQSSPMTPATIQFVLIPTRSLKPVIEASRPPSPLSYRCQTFGRAVGAVKPNLLWHTSAAAISEHVKDFDISRRPHFEKNWTAYRSVRNRWTLNYATRLLRTSGDWKTISVLYKMHMYSFFRLEPLVRILHQVNFWKVLSLTSLSLLLHPRVHVWFISQQTFGFGL